MAIRLADTARPNNYVDAEHPGTFPVAYAEDVWFADGTRLSEKTFGGDSIQKEELPLASADEEGNVYQYIGESGTYTHGCFYECVKFIVLGESTYEWKMLNVIKNPVVSAEQPFNVKDYEDETVIVYSGEDLYDFKQGHHYIVKNNIGMDLYLIMVTIKEGEEPVVAFVKNNPAQIGEHFYDVSGFCIGIIADITDVSISYYLFSSQTIKTYENPRLSDTSAHFSATDYFDIGGGDAVGGIIDVETLPTADIKNTFYRTKEDVGGKTRTIEVSLSSEMSFDEKVAYLSQYFIVHPDQANNRIDIETYPDLDMTRASWTDHYSVPENTLALMYLDTERIELHYDSDNSGTPHTETSMVIPLLFSSSHFPSAVYYAGDEANQTTERMATYKDIPKEFTGTQAEWDALTVEQKKTYDQVNITDDENDPSVVVDAVTDGDMHAVTSNAVAAELEKVKIVHKTFSGNTDIYGNVYVRAYNNDYIPIFASVNTSGYTCYPFYWVDGTSFYVHVTTANGEAAPSNLAVTGDVYYIKWDNIRLKEG